MFEYIGVGHTHIDFENTISINEKINVIDFQYCYNGGGVGIGDFNGDELPDIIFTGNQVSSKIYLNQGGLRFRDITKESKFNTKDWVTGVSIVDINADGLDDIYLNVGGADCNGNCRNLLFINQGINKKGIPEFIEQAKEYNLDDSEYSQQTVFFDYDLDGDLDAYIVRNGNVRFDKNSPIPKRYFPKHLNDVLLRNDTSDKYPHPVFTDVTEEAKGSQKGFGLGVGINDFNNDGRVDVYVSNDFITNDLLYLNVGSGDSTSSKFKESSSTMLAHETYNAMGVDIADINNDTYPDIMVLDMLPSNYKRLKTMIGAMNYDKYMLALKNGYTPQYMRNTLQLNNGFEDFGKVNFTDVAFMANVSRTDWSWAPLLADFDADGDKDVFVTNGYGLDITNLDFINYTKQSNAFGTVESRDKKIKELVSRQRAVKLQNIFFENSENLNFEDVSLLWSDEKVSLSNGAAFSDLDLDGDLDLIINNINEKAFILKNNASSKKSFRYLKIRLNGSSQNKHAIGAKVTIWNQGKPQTHFQSVVRGYLSSVDPIVFFGVKNKKIDSLEVKWPTGAVTRLKNIASNQTMTLEITKAKKEKTHHLDNNKLFTLNSDILSFTHRENVSNDYLSQQLLLTQHSKQGPCFASANINGIRGDELFIGGSKGIPGTLWALNEQNRYVQVQKLDSIYEDMAAIFIDYDSDEDLDLYVASGGNEFNKGAPEYADRLYENLGDNGFALTTHTLPANRSATSCVKPFDYDKDGDVDIFVGANIVPGNYPETPCNYLLSNENGFFTETAVKSLANSGMVKDAVWADIDNDGWSDLVLVGDWMSILVFKNHSGTLRKWDVQIKNENGETIVSNGWWRSIAQGDFDNDGDLDFLIANQGSNNFIDPTQKHPAYIYNQDYDGNGSIDPLIAVYYTTKDEKKLMPLHSRDDVMKQLVSLKGKYQTYEQFAEVDFRTLLNIDHIDEVTLKAHISESSYLENLGQGSFKLIPLPKACQVGPINSFLVKDLNNDKNLDVLLAGNDFYAETHFGGYDGLTGIFLEGFGSGKFKVLPSKESGFYLPGHTSQLIEIKDRQDRSLFLAGQNNKEPKIFELNKKSGNE
ncbi:VCBS repeat-containing protein [Costertonia aggregata]|uniref:VCBS repeat-containing protein n=1 Tax=Costertonia aggregata TaxID=343403 RepID=UPI001D14F0AA|nr:VCBS repeat-containing protein [Costertonia aggregata]